MALHNQQVRKPLVHVHVNLGYLHTSHSSLSRLLIINLLRHMYRSNSHIGFDPDYECHKKTRLASNKTPDERMAYLVVVIVQEGNNK